MTGIWLREGEMPFILGNPSIPREAVRREEGRGEKGEGSMGWGGYSHPVRWKEDGGGGTLLFG